MMKKHLHLASSLCVTLVLTGILVSVFVFPAGVASRLGGPKAHAASACASPPAGFNPSTASTATLLLYGFPPKPSNPTHLENWLSLVNGAKTHICGSTAATSIQPVFVASGMLQTTETSDAINLSVIDPYWSGYSVVQGVQEVYGEFDIACASYNSTGMSAYSVVGMGSRFWIGATQTPSHRFIYNIQGTSPVVVSGWAIGCPDHIRADAQYDATNHFADLFVEDTSVAGAYFSLPSTTFVPNLREADWSEGRAFGSSLYQFGQVHWTAVQFVTSQGVVTSPLSGYLVVSIMKTSSGGTLLAQASPLTPLQRSNGTPAVAYTDVWYAGS